MRYFLLTLFSVMTSFSAQPLIAQYNMENLKLEPELAFSQFSHQKLRLYPITANRVFLESHKNLGNYVGLKDALAEKKIAITERGAIDVSELRQPVLPDPIPEPGSNANDSHVLQHQILTEPNTNQNEPIVQENVENEEIQQRQLSSFGNRNGGEQQLRQSAGGDEVNRLFIENKSQDTVFIMAGEIVTGGKQDRVIAQDMIIAPNSGPIDLSVFCVEKGRWHYGTSDGKFGGYANFAGMNVRKAAVKEQNQSAVWDSVQVVTQANRAGSSTDAYTALAKSDGYQAELKKYLDQFADLPKTQSSVIGVLAVTDDRVIGCDMFATPDLFAKAYPGLLHSYATEAITRGSDVSLKDEKVQAYLSNFLSNEQEQMKKLEENGAVFEHKSKKIHITTY